ncbi:helix-turn-helix transcriptional regulator [Phenylobacterium sp.]|uniref:helix-turn-helix domain-containing protein n=1 Tax=Phenylobacterium sp. TaxID=1871053 RepID=UPI002DE2A306|nr:helix-turn-helix transcriptional regulator [Phenylobacterium sp.]
MDDGGPDRLDQALGLAIRLRRHARGLSQSALGEAIGVSFQQIQKYERGSNRVSFSTMVRICEALGCHVSDLVAEVEQLDIGAKRDADSPDLLTQPEAAPLLEALAQIRSPGVRRAVLELARGLARES